MCAKKIMGMRHFVSPDIFFALLSFDRGISADERGELCLGCAYD